MPHNDDFSYSWERISLIEWLPRTDPFWKLLLLRIGNGDVPIAKLVCDQDRQQTTIEPWGGPPPSVLRVKQLMLRDLHDQPSNDKTKWGKPSRNRFYLAVHMDSLWAVTEPLLGAAPAVWIDQHHRAGADSGERSCKKSNKKAPRPQRWRLIIEILRKNLGDRLSMADMPNKIAIIGKCWTGEVARLDVRFPVPSRMTIIRAVRDYEEHPDAYSEDL